LGRQHIAIKVFCGAFAQNFYFYAGTQYELLTATNMFPLPFSLHQ